MVRTKSPSMDEEDMGPAIFFPIFVSGDIGPGCPLPVFVLRLLNGQPMTTPYSHICASLVITACSSPRGFFAIGARRECDYP